MRRFPCLVLLESEDDDVDLGASFRHIDACVVRSAIKPHGAESSLVYVVQPEGDSAVATASSSSVSELGLSAVNEGGTARKDGAVATPSLQRVSGTLGQLFILLYRWLGGKKSFVYSLQDSLTVMKMAQMKSADDEVIKYDETYMHVMVVRHSWNLPM